MTRRALIGVGGPVVAALVEQLGAVPGLAGRVELHLSPMMDGGRAAVPGDVLARAVVVLDEGGALSAAERAGLAPGCAVLALPRLGFAACWQAGGLEDALRAMFAREAGCDVRVAGFVLSRFRRERLFHGPGHPAGPLLEQVMAQVLGHPALLGLVDGAPDAALRAVAPGLAGVFADHAVPVPAAVAAALGLAWWTPPEMLAAGRGLAARPVAERRVVRAAAEVARTVPFFATAIDPAVAAEGAALLSTDSARYAAAETALVALDAAVVLGCGAVLHDGDVVAGTLAGLAAAPEVAGRRVEAPCLLGVGAGWADDPHGMTGVMPRLVLYARLRRQVPGLVLLLPEGLAGQRWLADMLGLLGVGEERVAWLGAAPVACPRLWVCEGLDGRAVAPFVAEAAGALAGVVALEPGRPGALYLHAAGRLANGAAVAGLLSALGFVVVDVARASLAERIALLRGARVVVAAQGGALAEMAFCPAGAAVVELLGPADASAQYWSIASVAGLQYGYVVGAATEAGFVIAPDMLEAAVRRAVSPQ